jgi:hypothetical protein
MRGGPEMMSMYLVRGDEEIEVISYRTEQFPHGFPILDTLGGLRRRLRELSGHEEAAALERRLGLSSELSTELGEPERMSGERKTLRKPKQPLADYARLM